MEQLVRCVAVAKMAMEVVVVVWVCEAHTLVLACGASHVLECNSITCTAEHVVLIDENFQSKGFGTSTVPQNAAAVTKL